MYVGMKQYVLDGVNHLSTLELIVKILAFTLQTLGAFCLHFKSKHRYKIAETN